MARRIECVHGLLWKTCAKCCDKTEQEVLAVINAKEDAKKVKYDYQEPNPNDESEAEDQDFDIDDSDF